MTSVIKSFVQLLIIAFVVAVAFSFVNKFAHGGELAQITLTDGEEIIGEITDSGGDAILLRFQGEATTLYRPIYRRHIATITSFKQHSPPRQNVEVLLKQFGVPTIAELVRQTLLGTNVSKAPSI